MAHRRCDNEVNTASFNQCIILSLSHLRLAATPTLPTQPLPLLPLARQKQRLGLLSTPLPSTAATVPASSAPTSAPRVAPRHRLVRRSLLLVVVGVHPHAGVRRQRMVASIREHEGVWVRLARLATKLLLNQQVYEFVADVREGKCKDIVAQVMALVQGGCGRRG